MDLRVLRYFLTVVREENITAAAETLHITQPTLSRQLMDLEEELGTQLLIRGGRSQRMTLTEKGMLLRRRAEELIELADITQKEIRTPESRISGQISIGSGETDAMRIVARTARCMHETYPGIHFQLYSGNAEDVKERLDKGLLDFGIFIEPADLQKYEQLPLPAVDTWGLLVRKDHPLAAQGYVTPADLPGLSLMISHQWLADEDFGRWLGYDVSHLNIVSTYNLIFNAAILVDEGVGCAITLDKLTNTTGNCSLCFLPLRPEFHSGLSMAWKKYQIFTKATEAFLECLRTTCSRIRQQHSDPAGRPDTDCK